MESLSMDLFMVLNLEYQTHFSMCQQNFHLNPKNTLSKKGLGVGDRQWRNFYFSNFTKKPAGDWVIRVCWGVG